MSAAWVVYVLAVSALVGLAAVGTELAARALGRQARVGWIVSMALSAALPFVFFLAPADESAGEVAAGPGVAAVPTLDAPPDDGGMVPIRAAARHPADPGPLHVPLPWGLHVWAGSSVLVLLLGGVAGGRILRRARRWPAVPVGDGEVLRSDGVGPAVVGLVSGRVVLPEWAFRELTDEEIELAVRHEAEHVRARDLLVLSVGGLLVALVPWNPALWWQLRRLARAVELDCDVRTVRRGADPGRYARLLVDVASRAAPVALFSGPAFSRASSLGARIDHLTAPSSRWRPGMSLIVAALAMAAACGVPMPAAPVGAVDTDTSVRLEDRTRVSGRLLDPAAFRSAVAALAREPAARDARAVVALAAAPDGAGRVQQVRVDGVSGPAVPAAAVDLARGLVRRTRLIRTEPERADGWIPVWVVFHERVVEAHVVRAGLYAEKRFLEDQNVLRGHMEVIRRLSPLRFEMSRSMAAADRPSSGPARPLVASWRGVPADLP